MVDGLFHADPHPGNVFLTNEHRIALLDLGMVGNTAPRMQEALLKILIAVSEGKGDEAANVVIDISQTSEEFDVVRFRRHINKVLVDRQDQGLQQINVGKTLLEVNRGAGECGLYVPSELTLLGKTLLQLDEIGKILDPAFDPNAAIRRNVAEIMSHRMRKQATQGSLLNSILEMRDFVTGLPVRLNKIMDIVGNSELEIKVRAIDAGLVMEGFQKIANRIAAGIILAALIVGASLLMQVNTRFQLFGYPGLAILCFLAATAGGFWLVMGIFIQDHKDKKKAAR